MWSECEQPFVVGTLKRQKTASKETEEQYALPKNTQRATKNKLN